MFAKGVPCLIFLLMTQCLVCSTIEIIVQDSQGTIIPGAVVVAPGHQARTTNEEGAVDLVIDSPAVIRVAAPGFEPSARRVDPLATPLIIVLEPAAIHSIVNVVAHREELGTNRTAVASSVEINQTGARTVFDAIDKLVPSAFVTRRGVMGYGIASGGTGSVSIRGVGSTPNTGILVVVDGRPDYMGMMGHPLPDFYSLPDAETVSVTQGPASVLYGTNAMGGAVDIKPSRPVEGMHTKLSGSLGSYWTGQYRLKHGAGYRKWFYNATGGVDHTNGHRPSSHFRNQDGTIAAGYNISDAWKTSLRGRYGHFVVEDPGVVGLPPGNWASVGRGGFSWGLENSTNRVWGSTRAFSSWGHHHISDGWRSNDHTSGGRGHQNFLITPTLLVDAGADVVDYGGQGRNIIQGRDYGGYYGRSGAGFSRIHWTPLRRVRFNTGFRYEYNSIFGGVSVPELGTTFTIRDGYSLNLNVSRGFRNPTIRELYLFPAPNPNLQPEHMWNYQATLQLRPRRNIAASVTAYYADIDNIIVATGRWPNMESMNAGRALNRGLDSNLRWRLNRRLAFHAGYAYLRSTNLAPYIPEHKGTYSAEINFGRTFFYFGGVTVGDRWASTAKNSKLSGYTVPTLKWMVPLNRKWTVFAAVDNLFDQNYQVVTGYPMPGVNASGGFTLQI